MRLALSSDAAPGASLDELLDACARRGFAAVELGAGHGHGVSPAEGVEGAARVREAAEAREIGVAAFRLADPTGADAPRLARFQEALGAPLIVPAQLRPEAAMAVAGSIAAEGADVRVELGTASIRDADVLAAVRDAGCTWGWDLGAGFADPSRILGPLPGHIRFPGGGPESASQEGRGVGAFMARLALAGFGGMLTLTPSSSRYRVAWDAWLGRRGGWGCGSKASDPSLVRLSPAAGGAA